MKALDATGSAFFARQLEAIKARSFDVLYPNLKFRTLFPMDQEAPAGAKSVTYETYDEVGMAKIISSYAQDLPRADVAGKETTVPVRTIGSSFGYNVKEIKSAQMAGLNLSQRRANAARRAIEEQLNRIAFFGNTEANLYGLFTAPNIPNGNVPNGAAVAPEWSTKTADEILLDINSIFDDIFESTKGVENADTLLLPLSQWSLIMTTARSTTSDTTIANYVVANSPWLKTLANIIPVNELKGAGTAGVDVMVAYTKHMDKLEFVLPEDVTFYPEQLEKLEYITPVTAECGGLNVYYPLSAKIMEKI